MLPGPLFTGLSADQAEALERSGTVRAFAAGQTLFHEGDRPGRLIVILSGEVRIWRSSVGGSAMTIHVMGPGDVPGCVAVFRQIPYPATATGAKHGRTVSWPIERVATLLREQPVFAANAMTVIGGRTLELLQRLHEVSTEDAEQRVARALLKRAESAATAGLEVAQPCVRISRQELAELTATTLYTVSRIVSRWEREGMVVGGRGSIAIRDPEALAARAAGATQA